MAGFAAGLNSVVFIVARAWWGALPGNLLAIVVSTTVSTELNRRFTFHDSKAHRRRLHTQNAIAVLYYAFSGSAALFVLDALTGSATPGQELAAIGIASVIAVLGRFLVLRYWVFTGRPDRPENPRRSSSAPRAAARLQTGEAAYEAVPEADPQLGPGDGGTTSAGPAPGSPDSSVEYVEAGCRDAAPGSAARRGPRTSGACGGRARAPRNWQAPLRN